jgi:ParB-like chromosome segregation protein Spo0J
MTESQLVLRGNGFAVSRSLDPSPVSIDALRALGRETRKHPPGQIRKLQASIEQFGFVLPIVIDATSRVIAGWGLTLAAKKLGLSEIPAVTVADLDEARLRALRLALNRLSEDSRWDLEALRLEFSDIMEISGEIDLRISGFEMGEIDAAFEGDRVDEEDDLTALNETSPPLTKPGDLWLLGDHRILCANALISESYARLLGNERAEMIFTDPPWNIPIAGHVSGLGAIKHGDFAMGCGERSAAEFEAFLRTALGHTARNSNDGSIHFVCMHWGKIDELLAAATDLFSETKNLCVWNKTNVGNGIALQVKARADIRIQAGKCAAHQQRRTRPLRSRQDERLGLSWPEYPQRHIEEQAVAAPHRQASRPRRRCNSGLFEPQWRHPRSVRRRRRHFNRRREDGAKGPFDRD